MCSFSPPQFAAELHGSSCWILDKSQAASLYQWGFFGKGTLSRSSPDFGVPVLAKHFQSIGSKRGRDPHSLNNNSNNISTKRPRGATASTLSTPNAGQSGGIELNSAMHALADSVERLPADPHAEHLQLMMEEAVYLQGRLGVLTVFDPGTTSMNSANDVRCC